MEVEKLINELKNPIDDVVYKASDSLAHSKDESVIDQLIELLNYDNLDTRFLAARTLAEIENNNSALSAMFEAINHPSNASIQGDLVMFLEGFDLSKSYIELFKLYLFGSFKVSKVAKELLDYEEFDITPRVIKKSRKHWNHYSNNIKHDAAYELMKEEVEEMLEDLQKYADEERPI